MNSINKTLRNKRFKIWKRAINCLIKVYLCKLPRLQKYLWSTIVKKKKVKKLMWLYKVKKFLIINCFMECLKSSYPRNSKPMTLTIGENKSKVNLLKSTPKNGICKLVLPHLSSIKIRSSLKENLPYQSSKQISPLFHQLAKDNKMTKVTRAVTRFLKDKKSRNFLTLIKSQNRLIIKMIMTR